MSSLLDSIPSAADAPENDATMTQIKAVLAGDELRKISTQKSSARGARGEWAKTGAGAAKQGT